MSYLTVFEDKVSKLNSISEKPKLNFLVNAGLYLLDKRILKLLKKIKLWI